MTKTEFVGFRATPQERAALVAIRRAYDLPSLSEAARAAIRQIAQDRRLVETGSGQHEEAQHDRS